MSNASLAASASLPDAAGRFGDYGGRYVPETLMRALEELTVEYEKSVHDAAFQEELFPKSNRWL